MEEFEEYEVARKYEVEIENGIISQFGEVDDEMMEALKELAFEDLRRQGIV